ncbi:MAG: sugar transferase, partial [Thiohalomonadales bacterium]
MQALLYLVHRIPYPPNKGDKIRSYHLLQYLSNYYDVYLGTFVDDKNDWQYVDKVNEYCADSYLAGINPKLAKIKSLIGIVSNSALTIPYYYNRKLKSWVNNVISKH